jgi:xylulokinase
MKYSSFLGSLFSENYMPIDYSDASGMNLLDLKSMKWSLDCLKALKLPKEEIIEKLGNPMQSSSNFGKISQYFVNKYGFDSNCILGVFSGDNPNRYLLISFIISASLMLRKKGDISISLGTSHTIFSYSQQFKPNPKEGHVFISPFYEV